AGRMPGIHLSQQGVAEAQRLAHRLEREQITQVHSSPRERAIETAREIAGALDTEILVEPALDEIDCGEWTGRTFEDLRADPRWDIWNKARACARTPNGESMGEVGTRVAAYIEKQSRSEPDARIVAVSHADVI